MNETLKTLKERRSIRAYKAEQISDEALHQILEAGTFAASAKGQQSVTMVVVQERETIAELTRVNAEIFGNPAIDPFYGAPTIVVVLADPAATNVTNAVCDGALVMGNLMNAAYSLGIGSCWINRAKETFERPEGKALLQQWGLPERLIGVGNCALGYADGEAPVAKERKADYIVRVL